MNNKEYKMVVYVIKAMGVFIGVIFCYVGVVIIDWIIEHEEKKSKYLKWKRNKIYNDYIRNM